MDNDGADPSSADSGARSATRMMFGGGATPTPEPGASASVQSVPDPERAAPEESPLNETRVSVEPEPSTHQQTTPSGDYDRTNSAFRGTGVVGGDQLRAPADDGPRVKLQVGKMVPGTRYKIESWLGEGGMGVVYLAEHQDIGRKVALKILRLDLSQHPRASKVFRDEARTASKIGSRYIVDIFDFGSLPDGRLFFCMEVVKGADLVLEDETQWVEPARLIPILRQVCKGLHVAHQAKIVHRDIKPENILVFQHEGREDAVKILDFGVSAMLSSGDEGKTAVAGTPFYMAPEQIRGEAFDGRLDIYAMGCMAFELLTGRPPFQSRQLVDLLQKHCEEAPPTFAEVAPNRQIPSSLEALVRRCLAKNANDRFRDMADLEAALCEVQIELGLTTPWDDLEIPADIDDARRSRLVAGMPNLLDELKPSSRAPLWIAVGTAAFLGVAGTIWGLREPPTAANLSDVTVVDGLVAAARAAAARQNYVFPPARDPEADTAYDRVLEMEALTGALSTTGRERGDALREEFADALIDLGERFWESDATRPFARRYYEWAALFDPDRAVALERSGLTSAQLSAFRERARLGLFSPEETLEGQFAEAFAIEDESTRDSFLMETIQIEEELARSGRRARAQAAQNIGVSSTVIRAIREGEGGPTGAGEGAAAPAQAGPAQTAPDQPAEGEGSETGTGGPALADEGETDGLKDATADGKAGATPRRRASTRDGNADAKKGRRDPKRAAALAAEGREALKSGNRSRASQLYYQALSLDPRNATALMGLSDIFFDTGRDQQAVRFAERAVKSAPTNASYRLKLGDALFKVLRYQDALSAYEKAQSLGSSRAGSRIDKVRAKLGRDSSGN